MGRYEQKDVSFDTPEDWHDRTVVAYVAPPKPDSTAPPTLTITREKLRLHENLRTHANRELAELARGLRDFELHETRHVNVGGLPAVQMQFAWAGETGPVVQRLTLAAVHGTVFGFTATMRASQVAEVTPIFDRVLSTVNFPGMPRGPAY